MRVSDLKKFIELHVPYKYVINEFHANSPDDTTVVILDSSGDNTRTIANLEFQFLVRNNDPEIAEEVAHKIYNFFHNKSHYEIGETKIVMSKGSQSVPLYSGKDDNGRTIYSVNVDAIVDNN